MSFFVSTSEFALTASRVAALNKRAAKAGIEAVATLVELARHERTERNEFGIDRKYTVVEAELQGVENVKLGDWTVAATLDHDAAGNIFRTNPRFTVEIPEEFRGTDATRCDHCNTRRNRNQTVLVWNETEGFKQVGSDCVKMFLGVSPSQLIAFITELSAFEDEEGFGGRWGTTERNVTEFVAIASLATVLYGFHVSAQANATVGVVDQAMGRWTDHFTKEYPELVAALKGHGEEKAVEKANALAADALAWIATQTGGNYITNLRLAAAREAVGRNGGLLASLPNAYKRATEAQAAREAKAVLPASEHVGQEGEKINFTGKVVYTNRSASYSYYGPESLFVILVSDKGEKFYANTTVDTAFGQAAEDAETETVFTVTATVKGHQVTDKGEKVTKITRTKVTEVK